jgi:alginate O-acetyltransferase complex protein AlgI
MSLSSWLRDYLYISLGGNRRSPLITYRNLMLTMLLGGLWHGAAWTFVVWGGLHGLYLAAHKFWLGRLGMRGPDPARGPLLVDVAKIVITFHLVTLTWIFFRAPSFETAWTFLGGITSWQPASGVQADAAALLAQPTLRPMYAGLIVLLVAVDLWQARRGDHAFMVSWTWPRRALGYALLLVTLFVFGNLNQDVPFIYFQF